MEEQQVNLISDRYFLKYYEGKKIRVGLQGDFQYDVPQKFLSLSLSRRECGLEGESEREKVRK